MLLEKTQKIMNKTNSIPFNINLGRILLLLSVVIYVAVLNFTYVNLVVPNYAYWGFEFRNPGAGYLVVSFLFAVFPSFWLPISFIRPSLVFYYFQYFFIYIPFLFIAYYNIVPTLENTEALLLCLYTFLGITIMQSIYFLPLVRCKFLKIKFFWCIFVSSVFVFLFYTQVKFGRGFRLAHLGQIYEVRALMREVGSASGSVLGFYFQAWLANVLLPFLLAVSIFNKKMVLFFLVFLGYVYLYGIGGSKTTLFAMIYITGFYLIVTIPKINHASFFSLVLSLMLILTYPIQYISEFIAKWYIAIFHVRTLFIPAQLITQYFDFFKENQLTFMSHVTGVNYFVDFPYPRAISFIIGEKYVKDLVNSNAGFWASDGIAGFGLIGIIFISVVCAVIFYMIDSLSIDLEPRFVGVSLTFLATTLANAPLFTTCFTGGLWIFMAIFALLPHSKLTYLLFRDKTVST